MAESKLTLPLGQRVIVTGYLDKIKGRQTTHERGNYREPRHGLIVGIRTLSEGIVTGSYEDGRYLQVERRIPCYLVAVNRRSIIRVAPDQVIVVERE